MLKKLSITAFLVVLSTFCFAQNTKKNAAVSGVVTYASDGTPVEYAVVALKPSGLFAMTDELGYFEIKNLPAGKATLEVEFYGLEKYDSTFVAKAGGEYHFKIALSETSFHLEHVVVTAKRSEAGSSTASEISRQAMDHLQTSSLKDVMTLLPGVSLSNPSLASSQVLTIRNNAGTSSMNSLGTSVIVDGAPVSNNSNMQVLSTAQSGSLGSGVTGEGNAGTGVDIRGLSTDNIESVEVIRGIPSAQYGDLTSGAVIVKSKAGKSPLTIRFKTNPNIYQASASKGLNLKGKAGSLNVSGDYAYSTKSLTASYSYYQRASAKALWSVMPSDIVSLNTSLALNYSSNIAELNPDFEIDKNQSHTLGLGTTFTTNGRASVNGEWLKSVNWALNGTYTDKQSHFENTASNAMNLYSTSMVDGQTYTAVAGQRIYDFITHEEITNASESGVKGVILPYSYFYMYDIYGKEINGFAKLNAEFGHTWGDFTDKLLVGADYKTDGNLGKGSVYNDDCPPWRDISNVNSGYRKRPYYDIPFVNQIGAYAENQMSYEFAGRKLNLTSGLRYLWVNGLTSMDPRVNGSIDIFPWMTLRAGWGYASKAPTAIYLNPNYAYLDEINFNGMGVGTPVEERLLVATTHVYDSRNPDLQIARNRKMELGLDFTIAGKYTVALTAYDELMNNGYSFGMLPSSFVWYVHKTYEVAQTNPGSVPDLKAGETVRTFFNVSRPTNNIGARNRGFEYEIDLGRFESIRTSVYLNGAWTYGASWNNGYSYNTNIDSSSSTYEFNIGVYDPGRVKECNEEHITTLRLTHNIPEIGFVVTLTSQANWYYKYWTEYDQKNVYKAGDNVEYDVFNHYLSYVDGQMHDISFSESLLTDPEFRYLFSKKGTQRYEVEKYIPYVLFNLNISKEIGDIATASFYVNNVFNSRPLHKLKVSGGQVELGIPIFFGFEFKVNIK